MIFGVLLLLVFIVCVGMLWNEGMWTNCVNFVNVLFAALIATNYWEPLADFAETRFPSFTYVLDYLIFWALFCVAFNVLRIVTDNLSKTQVKFKMPVEQTGRILSVVAIGWLVVCFFTATLHTAPLARTAVRGGFQEAPNSKNFFGVLAPDRLWLGYVQHRSKNALATSPPTVFDEEARYIYKYGQRRQNLSAEEGLRVKPGPGY